MKHTSKYCGHYANIIDSKNIFLFEYNVNIDFNNLSLLVYIYYDLGSHKGVNVYP